MVFLGSRKEHCRCCSLFVVACCIFICMRRLRHACRNDSACPLEILERWSRFYQCQILAIIHAHMLHLKVHDMHCNIHCCTGRL